MAARGTAARAFRQTLADPSLRKLRQDLIGLLLDSLRGLGFTISDIPTGPARATSVFVGRWMFCIGVLVGAAERGRPSESIADTDRRMRQQPR